MVSSEPNSRKEKAISKSQFYYTATCLAPLNVLHSVGSNTVSNDLQLSEAHEYSTAALQMLQSRLLFTLTPLSVLALTCIQPQLRLPSVFHSLAKPTGRCTVWIITVWLLRFKSRGQTRLCPQVCLWIKCRLICSWNWLLGYINYFFTQFIRFLYI